jgi:hypothetical protein
LPHDASRSAKRNRRTLHHNAPSATELKRSFQKSPRKKPLRQQNPAWGWLGLAG